MHRIYWLTVTKGKPPSPRITDARNLRINEVRTLKPRLISRDDALTCKAVLLTLDQEFFFQNNEGTGSLPWINIKWQPPPSHHDWNCGHLPWPIDAFHHWSRHQEPKNILRDDLTFKRYIDEAILQNLRNKDFYKSEMHKMYNLVVGQTNKQLQEKAA